MSSWLRRSVIDQIPNNLETDSLSLDTGVAGDRSATVFLDTVEDAEIPSFLNACPWELRYAPSRLEFTVDLDGLLEVRQGDASTSDAILYARFGIESFVELTEATGAFLNPQSPVTPQLAFQRIPIFHLVEQIFFPFVTQKTLRLAKWSDVGELFPGINVKELTIAGLAGTGTHSSEHDDFFHYAANRVPIDDPRLEKPQDSDILLLGREQACTAGAYYSQRWNSELGIALRLTKKASVLFLLDALRHDIELKDIRKEFEAAKSWKSWLLSKQVSAPPERIAQIHHSIALRNARQAYVDEIASLSQGYEPSHAALDLFVRRRKMVQGLHDEMILQVEALLYPIPCFIEYPYAEFVGSSDRGRRERSARILLNALCKTLLFLPLEEIEAQNGISDDLLPIVTEVRKGRLSDGTFLGLHRRLRTCLGVDSPPSIKTFASLIGEVGERISGWLGSVLVQRNDASHAPFDSQSFVNTAAEIFPKVINEMRNAFHGIEFIVPKQVQPGRSSSKVLAWSVMGGNSAFRTIEFKTDLPADYFVTGELAALRQGNRECLVPLNSWFKAKYVGEDGVDIGLFDSLSSGEPTFTFINH